MTCSTCNTISGFDIGKYLDTYKEYETITDNEGNTTQELISTYTKIRFNTDDYNNPSGYNDILTCPLGHRIGKVIDIEKDFIVDDTK